MGQSQGPDAAGPVAEPAAAVAQPAGAGPAPLAPLSAIASGMGNAAFTRSLGGAPILARDTPGGGASTADGPSSTIPDDPAGTILRIGDNALSEQIAPKKPITKSLQSKFNWSAPAALGQLEFNIVPGFFAHFGVTASVAAATNASISLNLDRNEEGAQKYIDAVSVTANANANALLNGGMKAGLGVGFKGLNVTANASGSLKLDAKGSFTVKGTVKRTGGAGNWTQWGGGLDVDGELTGNLTAAASGYFQWQVLWWDGKFGEFKIKEWQLGKGSIKVKGTANLDGKSDIKLTPSFSGFQKPNVETKGQLSPPPKPATGQKVATKRFDLPSGGDEPPRRGLAAFEAMVAREGSAEPAPQAEPAPATAAEAGAPAPGGATAPGDAASPAAAPDIAAAETPLPSDAQGVVEVPGEPKEGEAA
jgi:hypothetical protein